MTGSMLLWLGKIRYLGVHFIWVKYFKCSLDYAKRSSHWEANSIYVRLGE